MPDPSSPESSIKANASSIPNHRSPTSNHSDGYSYSDDSNSMKMRYVRLQADWTEEPLFHENPLTIRQPSLPNEHDHDHDQRSRSASSAEAETSQTQSHMIAQAGAWALESSGRHNGRLATATHVGEESSSSSSEEEEEEEYIHARNRLRRRTMRRVFVYVITSLFSSSVFSMGGWEWMVADARTGNGEEKRKRKRGLKGARINIRVKS